MSKKLHAENNEKVCLFLREQEAFFDWVITTAFYSALHYVQSDIFPCDFGNGEHKNFETYYRKHKFLGKKPTPHKATIDLVFEHLPKAGRSYKWLHDTCMTARYRTYQMPKQIADKAIIELDIVKKALTK